MAHIQLPEGLPGIVGPLAYSPETAKPLLLLAETLLRGPNTLTSAEREMIAAHVSYRNHCDFCQLSHSAAAAAHLDGEPDVRYVGAFLADIFALLVVKRAEEIGKVGVAVILPMELHVRTREPLVAKRGQFVVVQKIGVYRRDIHALGEGRHR